MGLMGLLVSNLALWAWVWFVPVRLVQVKWLEKLGARGMALPGLIVVTTGGCNQWTLAHEEAHQEQMRHWSPLAVPLLLGWFNVVHWVSIYCREKRSAGFWELWELNPVERDADELARKTLAKNGRMTDFLSRKDVRKEIGNLPQTKYPNRILTIRPDLK